MIVCNWNIKSAMSIPDNLGKLPINTDATMIPVDDSCYFSTKNEDKTVGELSISP